MNRTDSSIQKKIRRAIMLVSGVVLVSTCAAFFAYEFITYKNITKRELATIGEIVASNSTAALAFEDKEAADEILESLKAQKHLVAVCLFDKEGNLFAYYPKTLKEFPKDINRSGYAFVENYLEGFQPVAQNNNRLGTLYIRSDLKEIYSRFMLYAIIAVVFILLSFLFAWLFSKQLQQSISAPILELAGTARRISDKRDYSVRAIKRNEDEIGILTDAFNHMLTEIQQQNTKINSLNINLEEKVAVRTNELQEANKLLKQQNEFIETIIDASIDLIAVFNKDFRFLMLNKQANAIYKINRQEIIGRNVLDVFPTLKGTEFIDNLTKAFSGSFIHDNSYKSKISDRYLENFFIPLTDRNGNTERVLLIGHDITTIMQANTQLKDLNLALEKSNQDLEQFAYVASHDLQEPLRKIMTFSDFCKKNIDDKEALNRYLEKISSSAFRMSELIRAVLNYSRLSHSGNELSDIDLNAVVEQIKTDLELTIEEKKAEIITSPLPKIKGTPLQINQLFLNLISNALKFSAKSPKICISSAIVTANHIQSEDGKPGNNRYLELVFQDNGIGFEQQYANRIFSIFQRLHSNNEYSGTGIGLALCKKIVENHKGFINVKSDKGIGTSFFVYLPYDLVVEQKTEALPS